jgi:hypothetical protein
MAIIKFPQAGETAYWPQTKYMDYGYDDVTDTVISYKRDPVGERLARRSSYVLNGWTFSGKDVREAAREVAQIQHNVRKARDPKPEKPVTSPVAGMGPQFPYVMFSKKNEASQYFFAGTTIAEALERFAKRGEIIDPAEATIINVDTGKIHKLVPTTIYKLV